MDWGGRKRSDVNAKRGGGWRTETGSSTAEEDKRPQKMGEE